MTQRPVNPGFRIVVLISGRGTNLGAIIDAVAAGTLPVELAAVVCNEPRRARHRAGATGRT